MVDQAGAWLYSYVAPTITGISSTLGPVDGGLRLTVLGSGYGAYDGEQLSMATEASRMAFIA